MVPKDVSRMVPKGRLMSEAEWRGLGVQQSRGWIHYMVHDPGELATAGKVGVTRNLLST